ncbi:uncharacterized protein CLUP02_13581 [Colletotrichum lupini]|uniref:Uncharacterized protein n=1 Tax=Colletotrichum lupini TaxID=145971 RepID=A0A9Q8WLT4_9PEZI|nr:uncharacterized protein CLUP02_13581 [Colletotrichum lupini]UQC88059.1 hypothetical protein CLUP02_13581 [Colletotrichum lupini]
MVLATACSWLNSVGTKELRQERAILFYRVQVQQRDGKRQLEVEIRNPASLSWQLQTGCVQGTGRLRFVHWLARFSAVAPDSQRKPRDPSRSSTLRQQASNEQKPHPCQSGNAATLVQASFKLSSLPIPNLFTPAILYYLESALLRFRAGHLVAHPTSSLSCGGTTSNIEHNDRILTEHTKHPGTFR